MAKKDPLWRSYKTLLYVPLILLFQSYGKTVDQFNVPGGVMSGFINTGEICNANAEE